LVHREAITHSQLIHPNILPFLGIYHQTAESPPITILPLMERGSLQDTLNGSSIDTDTFSRIVSPISHHYCQLTLRTYHWNTQLIGITSGVVYLHSRSPSIVHGDLHPGNILLDLAGNPYLCDFGLSRIRHEITRTRTMIQEAGRLRFLAPELSGGWSKRFRTSPASDIFSLAMTFYNAWGGRLPFHEVRNDIKVAGKYRKGLRPDHPSDAVALAQTSKQPLWELLQEMWAQEPSSRP
ncbi:kinase-like protein, partial [Clavulina sp. PMI_390]